MTDTDSAAVTVRRGSTRPPATSTVRDRRKDQWRCDVAAQAVLRGIQDVSVTAVSFVASGNGVGRIAVRVGRVLVYVEDRDSLNASLAAWARAAELAESAFGPLFNAKKAETAARIRRDGGTPPV